MTVKVMGLARFDVSALLVLPCRRTPKNRSKTLVAFTAYVRLRRVMRQPFHAPVP